RPPIPLIAPPRRSRLVFRPMFVREISPTLFFHYFSLRCRHCGIISKSSRWWTLPKPRGPSCYLRFSIGTSAHLPASPLNSDPHQSCWQVGLGQGSNVTPKLVQ